MNRNGNDRVLEVIEFTRYTGSSTFYSNPEFNGALGQMDHIIVHVPVSEAGSGTPNLTVKAFDSGDGVNFAEVNTVINAQPLSPAPTTLRGVVDFPHGRFLRFEISMGSSSGTPTAVFTLRCSSKNA